MKYMLIVSAIILTGCAQQPPQQQMSFAEICDGYGFTRGTEAHMNCVMRVHQQRQDMAIRLFFGR